MLKLQKRNYFLKFKNLMITLYFRETYKRLNGFFFNRD